MNFSSITAWLSSGIDEAAGSFLKGLVRHAAAAAIQFAAMQLGLWHPTAPEAILAQAVLDRALKAAWIYATTGADGTVQGELA